MLLITLGFVGLVHLVDGHTLLHLKSLRFVHNLIIVYLKPRNDGLRIASDTYNIRCQVICTWLSFF